MSDEDGDGQTPRAAAPKLPLTRFLGFGIFLAIILGIFIAGPRFVSSGDRCHPQGLPIVKNVALEACVDTGTWAWLETYQPLRQMYAEGPHKIYFDTLASKTYQQPEAFRDFVLAYLHQYATNNEDLKILEEGTRTLGGRPWAYVEVASDTGVMVDYYYTDPAFGSAQLIFFSFNEFLAERKALAEPILQSVKFTTAG